MPQELAILIIRPLDECFEELVDEFPSMVEEAKRFPGCIDAFLAISHKRKEILVQHRWKNRDAQNEYLAWRGERGDLMRLSERIKEEPFFRSYSLDISPSHKR